MLKFLMIASAVFFYALGANAQQQQCAPYPAVVDTLGEKHGERIVFQQLSTRGYVLTITYNEKSESWTALAVHTNGLACMLDAGGSTEPAAQTEDG